MLIFIHEPSLYFRTEWHIHTVEYLYSIFFSCETAVMRSHLKARGDSLPAASRPDRRQMLFPAAMATAVMQPLGVRPRSCLAPFARYNENKLVGLDWTSLLFSSWDFFSRTSHEEMVQAAYGANFLSASCRMQAEGMARIDYLVCRIVLP